MDADTGGPSFLEYLLDVSKPFLAELPNVDTTELPGLHVLLNLRMDEEALSQAGRSLLKKPPFPFLETIAVPSREDLDNPTKFWGTQVLLPALDQSLAEFDEIVSQDPDLPNVDTFPQEAHLLFRLYCLSQAKTHRKGLSEKRQELAQHLSRFFPNINQKLPFELLSDIFGLCITPDTSDESTPPYHLAQVCRQWRDVSYATPRLWTTFVIDFTFLSDTAVEAITSYLERSKKLPLTLRLYGELRNTSWKATLSCLLHQFTRWQHLFFGLYASVSFSSFYDAEPALSLVKAMMSVDSLPALESLELVGGEAAFGEAPDAAMQMFLEAPALRSLTLQNDFPDVYGISCHWPRLQELRVTGGLSFFLMEFLHHNVCESLTTLALDCVEIAPEDGFDGPLTLHRLSSLSITQGHDYLNEVDDLLTYLSNELTVPALKTLKIESKKQDGFLDVVDPLRDFLLSAECTTSLTMLHLQLATNIVPVLWLLPNLETLSVVEMDSDTNDLDRLCKSLRVKPGKRSEQNPVKILLPKLRHLRIETCMPTRLSFKLFVQMVKSRWATGSEEVSYTRLMSMMLALCIVYRFCPDRGSERLRELQGLRKDGFDWNCKWFD
ncbi:hypothetical protein D9758_009452 [Tetrapyrgos nigripes]|uniref:F-box domain-containing protein n=1 Tax=Tetrapyrgos nigripes TaxID=182062 RepID=A0A8H5D204_9AGAR|nr:hypothetical protein D9758_009452 [Tetrapyrgos nigripes]